MPSASPKTVKRRIKSIANTRKITKAMELVSAAKMRRAVSSTLATRPFATLSFETITALTSAAPNLTHPLLKENVDAKKTLFVLFTADRGLAGGFNANMIKAVTRWRAEEQNQGRELEVIGIGRRGADALQRKNIPVIARFEGFTNKPTYEQILPIGRQVLESFAKGDYRQVFVGYTDYVSGLLQRPRIYQLLPFTKPDVVRDESKTTIAKPLEYLFEPSPQAVFDRVLPRLIETMLYQALLESAASEHSARMLSMRNASEAAGDMLSDLKFTYNQIRQAGITREIAEISSGAAAVE